MSYDIYLRGRVCETCGNRPSDEPELPNPTYNLTPIFDLAITGEPLPNADVSEGSVVLFRAATDRPRGLRLLTGQTGAQTIAMLTGALARMRDIEWLERFLALEPVNGWGTLHGAMEVIGKLLSAACSYPDHVWEVR